jgi:hypothetical protein
MLRRCVGQSGEPLDTSQLTAAFDQCGERAWQAYQRHQSIMGELSGVEQELREAPHWTDLSAKQAKAFEVRPLDPPAQCAALSHCPHCGYQSCMTVHAVSCTVTVALADRPAQQALDAEVAAMKERIDADTDGLVRWDDELLRTLPAEQEHEIQRPWLIPQHGGKNRRYRWRCLATCSVSLRLHPPLLTTHVGSASLVHDGISDPHHSFTMACRIRITRSRWHVRSSSPVHDGMSDSHQQTTMACQILVTR